MEKPEFNAPTAYPVFYRTYSRRENGRESWQDVCDRVQAGLTKIGEFTPEESALCRRMQESLMSLPSGRYLWVGGTEWGSIPENFSSHFNCTSTEMTDWESFGLLMDLAMQGSGTGAVLEDRCISQLPAICNRLNVEVIRKPGDVPKGDRLEETQIEIHVTREYSTDVLIAVGDSRAGWVKAYEVMLHLSSDDTLVGEVNITVDIGNVRPSGDPLKGFGGVANPVKLGEMFPRLANILNQAIGRKLTDKECCLLIDEAALVVVAGNLRRSAGMRQFDSSKPVYKLNLWVEGDDGFWRIDPERDAMRMANHTRVYHVKPSREECVEAVRLQLQSGEGAIQYVPEAIARANADLLDTPQRKKLFLDTYAKSPAEARHYLQAIGWDMQPPLEMSEEELNHRMIRYGLNPLTLAA